MSEESSKGTGLRQEFDVDILNERLGDRGWGPGIDSVFSPGRSYAILFRNARKLGLSADYLLGLTDEKRRLIRETGSEEGGEDRDPESRSFDPQDPELLRFLAEHWGFRPSGAESYGTEDWMGKATNQPDVPEVPPEHLRTAEAIHKHLTKVFGSSSESAGETIAADLERLCRGPVYLTTDQAVSLLVAAYGGSQ